MKKHLLLTLLACLLLTMAVILVSCGEDSPDGNAAPANDGKTLTLNVYNWGEYISDGSLDSYDTNAEFEAYYLAKTGQRVKVTYTTYATNEDMYSKIKSGAGNYDIIIPSDYMIQKMADEGLLYAFNPAETVENYTYISDDFKGMYYDPQNQYSVPYSYGVVGVIYNTDLVDAEDAAAQSWSLLWNEKYRSKILQFNNPRDAFGSAMYYMNLDVNSTDPAVWQAAYEKLLAQKPLVQGYVSDEIFNKMTTGSAAIATYYAGDYITMVEDNESLAFYYPTEGTNVFVDAMCIPANAKNKALATEYINFMLSKDAAVANAEYIGYASPNTQVRNDPAYIEYMGEEAMEILYGIPMSEINKNYSYDPYYHSFTPEVQAQVYALWEGLKTENAIEPWIHIVAIGIVVFVVVIAGTSVWRRKKRIKDYCTYVESLKDAPPAQPQANNEMPVKD